MDQPGKADLPFFMSSFLYLGARKLLTILVILLWQSEAKILAEPPLVKAWKTGDEKVIFSYATYDQGTRYLTLTDADIADLVLPMARWLPFVAAPEISKQDRVAFFNLSPAAYEIKKRQTLSLYASNLIRLFAEQGRLNSQSQAIIPYLIEGMENPDVDYTGRDCCYALVYLTRIYDTRQPVYQQQSDELTKWYRKWWQKNHTEDLIVDKELRERIKHSFVGVCTRVEEATDIPNHALHGFKVPALKNLSREGEALYATEYFPRSELSGVDLGREGNASWIWIGVVSQSPLITTIPAWSRFPLTPEASLPAKAKEIYHEPIPNSDWHIKVYTKDTSPLDDSMIEKNLKSKT